MNLFVKLYEIVGRLLLLLIFFKFIFNISRPIKSYIRNTYFVYVVLGCRKLILSLIKV